MEGNDEAAAEEALQYIKSPGTEISVANAELCFQLVIDKEQNFEKRDTRDAIIATLIRQCLGARVYLAKKLQKSVTVVFEKLYEIGDGSASALTTVVLDPTAWPAEVVRETNEKDVFQLFIAKLIESGDDFDGRALKEISRLLAVNAEMLRDLIDEDVFDAILVSLDFRLETGVRTQATLATAKYLEVSQEKGQELLSRFITTRIRQNTYDDLIVAFSTAAAVFALVPSVMSALFLTEGFLPSLISQLEKKASSTTIKGAALDMLSAACIDGSCREAIGKHCSSWLQQELDKRDNRTSGRAAVILAKVSGNSNSDLNEKLPNGGVINSRDLVPLLRNMVLEEDDIGKRTSIEGLAYISMRSNAKEKLSRDQKFLNKLLQVPKTGSASAIIAFGTLTIIDNMTRYQPSLSAEQKRVSELKAYANASKISKQPDPLEDDTHVTIRCKALLNAAAVPFLVALSKVFLAKHQSPTFLALVANIVLSLSKKPSHRGTIAQQGGVPLLLDLYSSSCPSTPSSKTSDLSPSLAATASAHALARLLVSIDPSHVFHPPSTPSPKSALLPLLFLLTPQSITTDGPRDLLPTFESLLALTNLVSGPSQKVSEDLIRTSFPVVEDLLLNSNTVIQRATTELVCNLMTCAAGIEKLADGSGPAKRRLHILLALADVDDVGTRRAAGGALAMVTEFESAVAGILERERGVAILLGLCKDEDEGCVHRGMVCVRNVVLAEGDVEKRGGEALRGADGVAILQQALRVQEDREILEVGVEALKALIG